MLVSHESPLALLDKSLTYNDYDYALVHLLPLHPEYLEFFKRSKQNGRRILLDNSMFELREAFEASQFAHWIDVIKPFEYIVPDVFKDADRTIDSFMSWQKTYSDVKGNKIGVVQGTTYETLVKCYRFMSDRADKIAISFECPYFGESRDLVKEGDNKWVILMKGRQQFIRDLIRDNIWNWDKPHHLLGCALPQEFSYYRKYHTFLLDRDRINNIESIDTSNPVVAGMHNITYGDRGLDTKLTVKLADLLENEVSSENIKCIMYNVERFRSINYIHNTIKL